MELFNPKTVIDTVEALEAVVGEIPLLMTLKAIDHLDEGAIRWIAASPLLFAGFGEGEQIGVTLGGGDSGFVTADTHELRVPAAMLDDPTLARPGTGFGSLFLLPGTGETMRVNGRVVDVIDGEIRIHVEECFGHCAKAIIRSNFWTATPDESSPQDAVNFVSASRFMALATIDANGRADLSPKGDPADKMARVEKGCVWFADRPGNHRTDSFHNIIAQPHVSALFLVPGSAYVARISGTARMTTDEAIRASFVVQGKTPALAIAIESSNIELSRSPALLRAKLWPVPEPTHGIQPTKIFLEHMKMNKNKSLEAKLASEALSKPGFQDQLEKDLKKEYKDNLY
ncbi:pyridoxamine 5'-phosphate oxidase family protein [Paenibacillus oleatilyticus]|uniref:Pyridoxamine 5'-phosphate oxidase family protein n=1 Tax=Paenibacillus oleatilyticus TaxID=2594886 RepID=A0ABV4V3W2_9BACL